MARSATDSATILIATDSVTEAEQVRKLLADEFDKVFTTTDAGKAGDDFERYRPSVLVLAFATLEQAERYCLGLYRLHPAVQQSDHRTVILCNKDEVRQVYDLCKKKYFDDYVLFWPMTYDMSRLAMSVHHALDELAAVRAATPSAGDFAVQARRLAELERLLEEKMVQGNRHIDLASHAMKQVEKDVGTALDGFSRRLIEGDLPTAVTVNDADALRAEFGRLKREDVTPRFRDAAESARPLKQWADDFKQELAPHLETARALNAMTDSVRPTVLLVDDDDLQRKLVGEMLEGENYRLLFAATGVEALNVLRKTRPDVVLIDFMMPEMDGLEVTRRLKAAPQFARIPIIMTTGQSDASVVAGALKAGVAGFLVKPFVPATLIAKLRQALHAA